MSRESRGIEVMYRRSERVRINLRELVRCGVECTVAARLHERTLVTQIAPEWWVDDVHATGMLNEPVRLGLRAVFRAHQPAGLLRIDVAATATTNRQKWTLDLFAKRWGDSPWLWSVPWGTVGLHLGRILLPAPAELLVPVPTGEGLRERLAARERALNPYFSQVLWGDPEEAVERVIAQHRIPPDDAPVQGSGPPGVLPPLPVVTPGAFELWATLWKPLWRPVARAVRWMLNEVFYSGNPRSPGGEASRLLNDPMCSRESSAQESR